jgi:hypothetical protein
VIAIKEKKVSIQERISILNFCSQFMSVATFPAKEAFEKSRVTEELLASQEGMVFVVS